MWGRLKGGGRLQGRGRLVDGSGMTQYSYLLFFPSVSGLVEESYYNMPGFQMIQSYFLQVGMFLFFPHVSQEMIVKASPVLSIFQVSVLLP